MASPATRTAQYALAHERVIGNLRKQFNNRSVLFRALKVKKSTLSQGMKITLVVQTGNSGGVGSSSAGVLPDAGAASAARVSWNYARYYGTIEFAGFWIRDTAQKAASAANPMRLEMSSLMDSMRMTKNFLGYGAGDGVLATVTSASAAGTLIVSSIKGIRKGMIVDILVQADGNVGGGCVKAVINGVTPSTKTITLTSAVQMTDYVAVSAAASTYRVYLQNSRNDFAYGLEAIVSADNPAVGNYGGINRTTSGNEYWQAQVMSETNPRRISQELIQELVDLIRQNSNGGIPNLMITSPQQWNRLVSDFDKRRSWRGDIKKINAWLTGIEWAGILIVPDWHCPADRLYALNTDVWGIHQNTAGGWLDMDGHILKAIDKMDAYRAAWGHDYQLICEAPNQNGVIKNLDTTGIAA